MTSSTRIFQWWRWAWIILVALPPTGLALNGAEVCRRAEDSSPEVRAARAQVVSATRAIDFEGESPHGTTFGFEGGPKFGFDRRVGFEASVSAARAIELGPKSESRRALAEAEAAEARANLDVVRLRIRIEAVSVWASWLAAADTANALADTAELAATIEAEVKRRATAGLATQFDVRAAALTLARSLVDAARAQRDLDSLGEELRLLLDLDSVPTAPIAHPAPLVPALAAIIESATANSALVKSALSGVATAMERVRVATTGAQGDLGLGGFATVAEDSVIAGFSLSWDVPNGSKNRLEANVRSSDVDVAEAAAKGAERELVRLINRHWHQAMGHREHARRLANDIDPILESTRALLTGEVARGNATSAQMLALFQERRALATARVESEVNARTAALLLLVISGASF